MFGIEALASFLKNLLLVNDPKGSIPGFYHGS